jgi:predicted TIM-barrel fold metal-dependent hydrolase
MSETYPIYDAWMQHPTGNFIRQPIFDSLNRWMKREEIPDQVPVEFTLAAMDEAGIQRATLSAWHAPHGAMISNEEVAEIVQAHPDRFVGLASVNLYRPLDAVRDLRRWVKEYGFKGLRLLPWLWNLPPNDRRYYPLFAECCELGVPFCTQIGHAGPLCPSEPGRPIPYLDDVLLEFPELVVVGGHIGFPWMAETISLAMKYENFYIDSSAYKAKRYPPEFVAYLKGTGTRKCLFGSNYPMITPAQCLQDLDVLELDEKTKRAFLYENTRRVFNLD